jgi:hypothetical protein
MTAEQERAAEEEREEILPPPPKELSTKELQRCLLFLIKQWKS